VERVRKEEKGGKGKSPETLRVFFTGRAVMRFLKSNRLGIRQSKIIEAAVKTAHTPNPDLAILEEADRLIKQLENRKSKIDNQIHSKKRAGNNARLRGKQAEKYQNNLMKWISREYSWAHILAPVLALGILLISAQFVAHSESAKNHIVSDIFALNAERFPVAIEYCRENGKYLPENPDQIMDNMKKINTAKAKMGYWLRDGKIYLPLSGSIIPPDRRVHWFICVGKQTRQATAPAPDDTGQNRNAPDHWDQTPSGVK